MSEKDTLLEVQNDAFEKPQVDRIRRPHKSPKIRVKKKSKICCLIATAAVIVGAVLLTIFLLLPDDGAYKAEYLTFLRDLRQQRKSNVVKTILIWNKFNESRNVMNWYSRWEDEWREKCNSHVCIFTTVKNRNAVSSLHDYNAIVFNAANYYGSYMGHNPNAAVDERQYYVYASRELLANVKYNYDSNLYNLTMTYKLDSDISFYNYGIRSRTENQDFIAPAMYPDWQAPTQNWKNSVVWNSLQYRTNLTMARDDKPCTRNTVTASDRLVKKLKSYIDVDTYGDCGNHQIECAYRNCDRLPFHKYKFYLIAERELCTDYVSDELYEALQESLVPVVFGGANYTRFAPPHSYIDANDFASVRELAEYLQHLDANPDEYVQYMWWRSLYRVSERNPLCDLCELLNDPPAQQSQVERWEPNDECRNADVN